MQDKSYDFEKIKSRFATLASKLGYASPSALAGTVGYKQNYSLFFAEGGGRNITTLAVKLYEAHGVNVDWFLIGREPVFVSDIESKGEEVGRYERAGRLLSEAMRELLPPDHPPVL